MSITDIPILTEKSRIKTGARNMTESKKKKATALLKEQESLRGKIKDNKRELNKIKKKIKANLDPYLIEEMKNRLFFGENLIKEQNKRLEELSPLNIAEEVGITQQELNYFNMSTKDNWRKEK